MIATPEDVEDISGAVGTDHFDRPIDAQSAARRDGVADELDDLVVHLGARRHARVARRDGEMLDKLH
ncbi:hypothetical protein [Methylosinus sp. PW1]|uniref:hypothetical protein n=1 Tax=Methylosinus sp. PW1 TaxID=107636 RepID=UPI0018DC6660|nr:hypothetical protein [Methylosinus sp. PW1]